MPYEIKKKGTRYQVKNSDTNDVKAKATTKAKAKAQVRLLISKEQK